MSRRVFKIQAFSCASGIGGAESDSAAEEAWRALEDAFRSIYAQNATGINLEDLYRRAYNMVLHRHGEMLYSGLVATMTSELNQVAEFLASTASDELFLQELLSKWHDHSKAADVIGDILLYMDRTFVPANGKAPVLELARRLWRDLVIRSDDVRPRLLRALLAPVRGEEASAAAAAHGEAVARATRMFLELGADASQEDFEQPFLDASARFSVQK